MSVASKRRIVQIYGPPDQSSINEAFRQISEMIYSLEGRRGFINLLDQVKIDASQRKSPLRLAASGRRGYGALAFGGIENASLFLAKGAYLNDGEAWIAEDSVAVILELNRESSTPQMYRNTGLSPGDIFTPQPVGWIAIGSSTGIAQGALQVDVYTGISNLQLGSGLVASAAGSVATLTPSGIPQAAVVNLSTDLAAKRNRLMAIATPSTTYNVSAVDDVVLGDATGGAFNVNLPAGPSTGQAVVVKKIDSSGNAVTVQGNGKNIDGSGSYALSAQWAFVSVVYGGSLWEITAK